jgi:hypothetical protein
MPGRRRMRDRVRPEEAGLHLPPGAARGDRARRRPRARRGRVRSTHERDGAAVGRRQAVRGRAGREPGALAALALRVRGAVGGAVMREVLDGRERRAAATEDAGADERAEDEEAEDERAEDGADDGDGEGR